MATVRLEHINKIYEDGFQAVYDFNIDIKDKEFIVFVGPSGCGKSTTLRMVAGLEDISTGSLYIDDDLMNNVEPKDRGIAMVFQNYSLYPNMTVRQNMGFALEMHGVPKEERNKKVEEVAKILELTDLLDKKPKALSGGQRQRVALGRAIAREPKVFLMDEPLSNLDAKLRTSMRTEITNIHRKTGTTTIYVTHDQTEAMTMADRIVIMKQGFVQQIGTPEELYKNPANLFVATFIGTPSMNILEGELTESGINVLGINIKLKEDLRTRLHDGYEKLLIVNETEMHKLIELMGPKRYKNRDNPKKKKKGRKNYFSYEEQLKQKEEQNEAIHKCLESNKYTVKFGIRPEDIYMADYLDKIEASDKVEAEIINIEMLGKNYLIHVKQGEEVVISNVTHKPEKNIGEPISLCLDLGAYLLFDPITGVKLQ
ncbi:MAG: ATP-binding cassette domain-containing protein [Bacilli bacterium]|nr:ATP-binding cassette domain-containing protein [Bacilli bacterium]